MTANETKAVKYIESIKEHAVVTLDHIAKEEPNVSPLLYKGREEKANTILTMIEELQQYRAIGTVEECRDAVEKMKTKKPTEQIRLLGLDKGGKCPSCQKIINSHRYWTHCDCGQKLDWSDEK